MFALIIGNPVDGFKFYGPYRLRDDAINDGENSGSADWWVANLYKYETER